MFVIVNRYILGIGVFTFLITSTVWSTENKDELVFAQVIYRHGNRTIFRHYDPNKNSIQYWPEGMNALTNVGKRVTYNLGKFMRRRYHKLIGDSYSPDKVYIRSTDIDRSIMSALCNAAGLFPPSANQMWDGSINWQPVPVHTIPIHEDYLLYQSLPCDMVDKLYKQFIESDEIKAILNEHNELCKHLEIYSGQTINGVQDFHKFYDSLLIEDSLGLPLSNWEQTALKSTNGSLEYLTAINFAAYTHTNEMKKAKTGFLIKEIFDRFKNKSLSLLKPDRSLWIYSAHDVTIVNVLNALNVYEYHMPPFAASIHFELFERDNEYYVQLFYRRDNSEYIPPINIPNCGIKCPLDSLFSLYKDILPTANDTYESLCQTSQ